MFPFYARLGNTLYANQLQKRVNYSIMYGNQNDNYTEGQFVVQDKVCPRSTPLPTTTTTNTEPNNSTRSTK